MIDEEIKDIIPLLIALMNVFVLVSPCREFLRSVAIFQ